MLLEFILLSIVGGVVLGVSWRITENYLEKRKAKSIEFIDSGIEKIEVGSKAIVTMRAATAAVEKEVFNKDYN